MRTLRGLLVAIAAALACLPWPAAALQPGKPFHDYVRASWSLQDGLPQVSVTAIAQDRPGYIWLGTQAGLARFDGVRFTRYTPDTHPGLPGTSIQALRLARDGRLWLGTYKGAATWDGRRFTHVPAAGGARAPVLSVNALAEGADGRMWVAADAGVFRAGSAALLAVPGGPAQAAALLARADGMWIGSRQGVHRPVGDGWMLERLPAGDNRPVLVTRLVAAQGRLWAATTAGLFVRDAAGWARADDGGHATALPVDLLHADAQDNLWAGGDFGLLRIRAGRTVEFVSPADARGIAALRTAFEDREGSLWLGSRSEGVVRVRDGWTRRFSVFEGLRERIVWTLSPDPDGRRTWVGSDDGISVLEGGRFTPVVASAALPHPQPYNLLAEADRLWIGTRRGLAVVEHAGPQAGRVQQPAWMGPLRDAQVNGLVRGPDGGLWIATSEGVFVWKDDRPRRYAQAQGLPDPRTRYLHWTRDGRLLAGTQAGLFVLQGERFMPLGAAAAGGLPPGLDITAIAELDDGRLVVGSLSEATYVADASDARRWHVLDVAHGLPSNAAFFFHVAGGFLWSAGIRGIERFPVADLGNAGAGRSARVRGEMLLNERGDSRSGQQGLCCNGAGNAKGFVRDGALWLPTRDGVVALDMASVVANPVPPSVVIERMQVRDQWADVDTGRRIALPEDARDVAFEYTVLSFQDPKSVGAEYRLRGYDRAWRSGDAVQRSVRYTNLPPGAYTFEVRGSNNTGLAGTATATLAFSVAPRVHETTWFRWLVGLSLALLVFAGYRLQVHRYRRRNDALELLVRQRTEALEAANRSLLEASVTDPLTGLRNRRYVARQILADLAHYERRAAQGGYHGEVIACALVDLDHFKRINDRHGHAAGDSVLVQVAQVLGALVRTADYVVRWGGEEFLLVFRPMPTAEVPGLGDRLCRAIAGHPFTIDGTSPQGITCSVGIAQYPLLPGPPAGIHWQQLLELADRALYRVKSGGRNGWASLAAPDDGDPRALLDAHDGHADREVALGRLHWIGGSGAPVY